jgi:EmrB/QacA subfamily drug resistance transporter
MRAERRRTHYRLTFVVLAVAVIAYILLQSLLTPVLATIQAQLHTTQTGATWVLTSYLLSASIFTPLVGRLGDILGKKPMILIALAALAVGSLIAALASDIGVMILARVIQGLGGGLLPLAFGVIREEHPSPKVMGAVALLASLIGVGSGVGVVLAGPIADGLGFRWLFWLPLIVIGVTAVAALFILPPARVRTHGRLSVAPALLLAGWLSALLLALSEGPSWGWDSPAIVGLLGGAMILLVAWIAVENRAAFPLIDMKMMRRPGVWTTNLVAFLVGIGMYASYAFVPQFAETSPSHGYGFASGVTGAGLMLLPASLGTLAMGFVTGPLSRRWGAKHVVLAGCALMAAAFLGLVLLHDDVAEVTVMMTVLGIGMGLAFSALSSLIVVAVSPEQTGVASGMNTNIRTIGGSVGTAVVGSVIVASAGHGSAVPQESGYVAAFIVMAAIAAVSVLASLLIPVHASAAPAAKAAEQTGAEPARR